MKWKLGKPAGEADSDEEDYDLDNGWTLTALVLRAFGDIYS